MGYEVRIALSMAAMIGAFSLPAGAEVKYAVTDVGTLGGTFGVAASINNVGDIVGSAGDLQGTGATNVRAFRLHDGAKTDLGVQFGVNSGASALNASGNFIVNTTNSGLHAYLFNNGSPTEITGAGLSSYGGTGINDAGDVVGIATGADAQSHSFLYHAGSVQDLGVIGNARDINNAGQIIGETGLPNPVTGMIELHGFLYANGVVKDLGKGLSPTAINDAGDIVGKAESGAFLYHNGVVSTIGPAGSTAFAINNAGVIVGESQFDRAAIFENGQAVDLNTLLTPGSGLTLAQALSINDLGQIVGSADTASGERHAFLLTSVPEPTALSIALLGFTSLLRRRRTA